jgi:type III restriction enzyme
LNNLGRFGRWDFAEFTEVYQIESDFEAKVESEFNKMIEQTLRKKADKHADDTI